MGNSTKPVITLPNYQGCGTGKFEDGSGSDTLSEYSSGSGSSSRSYTYIHIYEHIYMYVYIFTNEYVLTY
jgi:hypothetical protein